MLEQFSKTFECSSDVRKQTLKCGRCDHARAASLDEFIIEKFAKR